MDSPRLSRSQRSILDLLKHHGNLTIPGLSDSLHLNVETVRGHLRGLVESELVRRGESIKQGPGRPEVIYHLTAAAEVLFPRREGEILQRLAEHMRRTGHEELLHEFFDEWLGERRQAALDRVRHLEGRARLDEVAAVMSELGFMAVVDEEEGASRLRLCHCPIRGLINATQVPCHAEIGFVKELLGENLTRESFIPAGDTSCTYRLIESQRT